LENQEGKEVVREGITREKNINRKREKKSVKDNTAHHND
jgi:hypothetical protein